MAGHGYHWENALAGVFLPVTLGSDLPKIPCAGLYVGVAGDVGIEDTEGNTVILKNVPAGQILPVKVRRVLSGPSTTASDIVAFY